MQAQRRSQTAFRLDESLLRSAKRKAREQGISLNKLVEKAVEKYVGKFEFPAIEPPTEIPEWVKKLSEGIPPVTQEELDADDRLAYIYSK